MIFTLDGNIDFRFLTEVDKAAIAEINSAKEALTPENAKIALAMAFDAKSLPLLRRVIKEQPAVFDSARFLPLAYAISADWAAGLEIMLKHTGGGIVNDKGQDALIFAAFFHAADCLRVASMACDAKRVDHDGYSALNMALDTRGDNPFQTAATEAFLLGNSDLDRKNNEGLAPFDQAVRHGLFDAVAKLAPKVAATPERFKGLLVAYWERTVPWADRDTVMIDEFGARCDLPGKQRAKCLRLAPKGSLPQLLAQHEAWQLKKVMAKTALKSLTEMPLTETPSPTGAGGAPARAPSRRI